jgi:hypothetical protein
MTTDTSTATAKRLAGVLRARFGGFPDANAADDAAATLCALAAERDTALARAERAEAALRAQVYSAYHEGYSDGYHTGNPQKDIAPDWAKSAALTALNGGTDE